MALMRRLAEARELAGYSQDDAANFLGVSRAMVSYWEAGTRAPNDRQLVGLARLYGVDVGRLRGDEPLRDVHALAQMMFRGAEEELPAAARRGLRAFEDFLDLYQRLAGGLGEKIHGMHESPFTVGGRFERTEDARRKAEEVRAMLRLGLGPIDVDRACDMLGVTVLRAPLGDDLTETISGAFFHHPQVGFSILVNLEMTPGRRRFTVAHELGHALFHSDERWVLSFPKKTPRERFADAFAGEFLMPGEGIRRVMEEHGFGPRVTDPADVIHLQRYFRVSYGTALVRLRQARLLGLDAYERFKDVRPVLYARALGYEVDPEELSRDPDEWRLRRYPAKFLRLVRLAVQRDVVSIPSAAELLGVSLREMSQFAQAPVHRPERETLERRETAEFEQSGVTA
jgi:Zn-dependent peptidase ImmA (M78 family)/DNA-binding XRE family transcriptional regulator